MKKFKSILTALIIFAVLFTTGCPHEVISAVQNARSAATATTDGATVALAWANPSTGYYGSVLRCSPAAGTLAEPKQLDADDSSIIVEGLSADTEYTFTWTSLDATGYETNTILKLTVKTPKPSTKELTQEELLALLDENSKDSIYEQILAGKNASELLEKLSAEKKAEILNALLTDEKKNEIFNEKLTDEVKDSVYAEKLTDAEKARIFNEILAAKRANNTFLSLLTEAEKASFYSGQLTTEQKAAIFTEIFTDKRTNGKVVELLNDAEKETVFNALLTAKTSVDFVKEILNKEGNETLRKSVKDYLVSELSQEELVALLTDTTKNSIYEQILAGTSASDLLAQLSTEKKADVLNVLLTDEVKDSVYAEKLTDAEKARIFNEILAVKRANNTFLSLLTEAEKASFSNGELTTEQKAAIFTEIFTDKRTNGKVVELLNDAEKETVFNALLTAKTSVDFVKEILNKEGNETLRASIKNYLVSELTQDELTALLNVTTKNSIYEQILAGKNAAELLAELNTEKKTEILNTLLTDEKKNEIFNEKLTDEVKDSVYAEKLTDAEKARIFNEILAAKRANNTFLSLLTEAEKASFSNGELTTEQKAAIFTEIFTDKRTNGKVVELLNDAEKETVFNALLTAKTSVDFVKEILNKEGNETLRASIKNYLVSELTQDELTALLNGTTKNSIYEHILAGKNAAELLEQLSTEKKADVLNILLTDEVKNSVYAEKLTDAEKASIFNEILAAKRANNTFLSLLTDAEKASFSNGELTTEQKAAIFTEIFTDKRTNGKVVELLNDAEKETVFNALLTAKTSVDFVKEILNKEGNETLRTTIKNYLVAELSQEELVALLNGTTKNSIYEQILAGTAASDLLTQLSAEKKAEILNALLTDEKKNEIFNEKLTDAEKASIFNELVSSKRADNTFLSLLTADEKTAVYNSELTTAKKAAIFDEIFADKRTNEKVVELLNDAEKETVFNALLTAKTSVDFVKEILNKEGNETLRKSIKNYLVSELKQGELRDLLSNSSRNIIYEQTLAGKSASELLEKLSAEKKADVLNVLLTDEKKNEIFNEKLTDAEKASIFNELVSSKRADNTFLSLLTADEKTAVYNSELTTAKKAAIFDEIFADKRTNEKVVELLNDAEKETVFNALLTAKTSVDFVKEILNKEGNETLRASIKNYLVSELTQDELSALLNGTTKNSIYEQILAGTAASDLLTQLSAEKKADVLNVLLTDEKKNEIFNEKLTDAEKASIFNELVSSKRADNTFLSLLTADEKTAVYNSELTTAKKAAIFDEIFADNRTNEKVVELLNDAEKETVFNALLTAKTSVDFVKEILNKDGNETLRASIKDYFYAELTQEQLQTLLDAKDTTPPASVTELTAENTGASVHLSWTDAADSDVLAYEITYTSTETSRSIAFAANSIVIPQGVGNAYISGLTNGWTYTFSVKTVDTTGNKSTAKTVTCNVKEMEKQPLTMTVTPDETNLTYKDIWVSVAVNSVSEVKKIAYKVYAEDDTEESVLANGSDITKNKEFKVSQNGTYSVAVQDVAGRRDIAKIVIDNIDKKAPGKVTSLKAVYYWSERKIKLSWIDPSDEDFSIIKVRYKRGNDANTLVSVDKGVKVFELTGVEPEDATYSFRVFSHDAAGNCSYVDTSINTLISAGDFLLKDGTVLSKNKTLTTREKSWVVAIAVGVKADGSIMGLGLKQIKGAPSWAKKNETGYVTKFTGIGASSDKTGSGAALTATITGDTAGSDNWEYVKSIDPEGTQNAEINYPAFDDAANYGTTAGLPEDFATGWYLPSIAELCELYKNKEALSASLSKVEGDQFVNNYYWSSSQSSTSYKVWIIGFGDGDLASSDKYNGGYVRCVRDF